MRERTPRWWKTYDYKTGHTFILGEKFAEKGQAMTYAKSCGMIILAQSTTAITDEQYRIALLENENRELRESIKERSVE